MYRARLLPGQHTHHLRRTRSWIVASCPSLICHLVSIFFPMLLTTTSALTREHTLLRLLGRDGKGGLDEPLVVVDLEVLAAHEVALALLVGQVAAHLVAVLLGLEGGDEVDAGPHLLAGELAGETRGVVSGGGNVVLM